MFTVWLVRFSVVCVLLNPGDRMAGSDIRRISLIREHGMTLLLTPNGAFLIEYTF